MLRRPSHILCPPDLGDPDFRAKCVAWTDQIQFEMDEAVALTKKTLTESKALMKQVDRLLAWR
jgi:hypothetical protein